MRQTIHIDELWCEALIGVYPHEREQKQSLGIYACIDINAEKAIQDDSIARTLDYEKLALLLKEHAETHPYHLLETLLAHLLELLKAYPQVLGAKVTLRKPQALAHLGATVALSGSFERS